MDLNRTQFFRSTSVLLLRSWITSIILGLRTNPQLLEQHKSKEIKVMNRKTLANHWLHVVWAAVLLTALALTSTLAAENKPNVLVIFGDDVGIANLSAYSDGLMGYTTPNID